MDSGRTVKRGPRSLHEGAFLGIARTAATLELGIAQALKPHGITPTQYNVLRILRGAGPAGLCRHEVGARLIRAVPDVTRLLDRMEDLHLITRERGREDRRYVTTRIAPPGLELLDRLEGVIHAAHIRQLGHLDSQSLKQLLELLDRVNARD